MKRFFLRALLVLGVVSVALAGLVLYLNIRGEAPLPELLAEFRSTPEQIARGQYLARIGNCMGCHTTRGGAPYAGGRGIATPFGVVYSTNLTPHAASGLGEWTADHFWRALHHGRAKDGRLLYPAFPYTELTLLTREDSDALYAYLRTLPPVEQPRRAHELRFPYDTQAALAVWRALFFAPATFSADTAQSSEWNRGAYLVRGLAHCNACHGTRNALGATADDSFNGAVMPSGWYAPSLRASREAGVREWPANDIVALLTHGVTARASVIGPMAEVVFRGTQYLSDADAQAMAVYLRSLSERPASTVPARAAIGEDVRSLGGKVYEQHCADCHGKQGEGVAGAFPALAGNRAVTLTQPNNAIRIVLGGGYLPATAGNPRPHGMPPYGHLLKDAEIAAVLSYVRNAWGNTAPAVSAFEVQKQRGDAGR